MSNTSARQGLLHAVTHQLQPRSVLPNWPAHEVFCYIDPDILRREHAGRIDDLDLTVREQLVIGAVQSWGMPMKKDQLRAGGVDEVIPLVLIPPTYWRLGKFNFMFFDSTAPKGIAHSSTLWTEGDVYGYAEVHFNKREVMRQWPWWHRDRVGSILVDRLAEACNSVLDAVVSIKKRFAR